MSVLAVEALNTLNEKGLRYKGEVNEGKMAFKFGMLVGTKKAVVLVTPNDESISVSGLGNEKALNGEQFGQFVEQVLHVKSVQEDLVKLEEALQA